jgi:hypothetical protein
VRLCMLQHTSYATGFGGLLSTWIETGDNDGTTKCVGGTAIAGSSLHGGFVRGKIGTADCRCWARYMLTSAPVTHRGLDAGCFVACGHEGAW